MAKKLLSKTILNAYVRDFLVREYNIKLDEKKYNKLLNGFRDALDTLIEDGYSFEFLGVKYNTYEKPASVYKNVNTGEIEKSPAHYSVKLSFPIKYKKELKEKTSYKTDSEPVLIGITQEEYEDFLKNK